MNTVIIFQKDEEASRLLGGHGLNMNGDVTEIQGSQVMVSEMTETKSAKGVTHGFAIDIYRAIVSFCEATLAAVQNDEVEVQVIFMFHQTSGAVARDIITACRLIELMQILQELADDANKFLKVVNVVLLSCESGADLVLQPPIAKAVREAIDQASDMRNAAKAAFKTEIAPPYPSMGTHFPTIITYSTGDVDRGGVVLDPFHVSFKDLDGRFEEHGDWHWNNPKNPDKDGEPDSGTVYSDNESTGSTTQDMAVGEQVNQMGFHPPP